MRGAIKIIYIFFEGDLDSNCIKYLRSGGATKVVTMITITIDVKYFGNSKAS